MPVLLLAVLLAQAVFTATFPVSKASLKPTGRADYFILEPGAVSEFDGGGTHLTITVLDETKVVDGVTTRVVEERETRQGVLVEVSRNYFAIDPASGDVFYFGEDVDMYAKGVVTSHEGSWLVGRGGASFGLAMPGHPVLRQRYQQETAPRVAMDRGEIVSLTDRVVTPAGTFTDCVRVEETTPLEPGVREYKRYAKGVGLVEDGDVKLVRRSGR